MRREGVTPAQAAKLDAINASGAKTCYRLSTTFSIFPRIESGKLILEDAPVYVQVILGNVCSMLIERARQNFAGSQRLDRCRSTCAMTMRIQQALINFVTSVSSSPKRAITAHSLLER